MDSRTNGSRFYASSLIVGALISLGIGRPTNAEFTLVDFAVVGDQANPNDPHEVFFPDFNSFTLMITGSFDTTQCYRIQLQHSGGSDCGNRNNSGNAVASVVEADHIVVTVAQTAQSDFKNGDNWIIEVKENREGCSGASTNQVHPISLRIAGCNQACILEGPVTVTADPNPVPCGGTTQICVDVVNSTDNLRYEWDLDGDNLFDDQTTLKAFDGNCIDFTPPGSVLVGVNVVDQGTELPDCNLTGSTQITAGDTCDDGIDCTTDTCDSETGCVFTPDDSLCDNFAFCDGEETCESELGCQSGSPPNCSDGVDCTIDSCNEVNDECDHEPDDSFCNNDQFCDGEETCDPALDCQFGNPPNCDDGVECTVDSCDEVNDECDHVPDDGFCNNDQFCDGEETCDPELNCQSGGPPNCDDGVECTIDSCDEVNDECDHDPDDGFCNNDQFCDGAETCDPELGCQSETPPNCDDGVECTNDVCDLAEGCMNTPDNSNCSDGVECTLDVCDPVEGCVNTPNNVACDDDVECTNDLCDPVEGCVNTPDDGNCADDVECTIDVCDAEQGCENTPDDGNCADGVECTDDVCDPDEGCSNVPDNSNCDDGVECTMDQCDAAEGCSNIADDAFCDDEDDCTIDTCDPELGCQNEPDLTDEDGDDIPDCLSCPMVDVVFVLDTSGSIEDEAEVLCEKNQEIIDRLGALGVEVRSTILGIRDLPEIGFTCLTGTVVGQFGSTVPGNPGVCATISGREDWGPATSIVAANFNWTENAVRVIVPIADEGPCDGDPCENPGADKNSIQHAIDIAHANSVRVAPITGNGSNACVVALANEMADETRLFSFASTDPGDDLAEAINDLLLSICLDPGKNGGGGDGGDDGDDGDDGDQCPTNPDKNKPGVCGCNVPDKDADGDSIPDCVDPAPLLAGSNGSGTGQETPPEDGGCGACGALGMATFPIAGLGYAILLLMRRRRI
jgi:hypothetical protein